MDAPTGATRVAGIIGDPVRHSLSPVIHNAAFTALGLDWVYVAFPVPRGAGRGAVAAMRTLGIDGLSVTMPHKEDAAAVCDELSPHAERLRSVNAVARRDDDSLFGDSTDGEGFLRALADEGVAVEGRRALVLGAGGAARAVALALVGAGAEVAVAARRPAAAAEAATLTGAAPLAFDALDAAVAEADLVVNATPLGMAGEEPPFDAGLLHPGQAVADLVYHPSVTPLLDAAARQGARPVGGLGMLVHQAVLAFTLWTGAEAPVEVMRQAARMALAG